MVCDRLVRLWRAPQHETTPTAPACRDQTRPAAWHRRGAMTLLVALSTLPALCGTAQAAAAPAEPVSVQAQREGSAVRVTTEAVVRAPLKVIWGALTDYNHLAEFIPGMLSSRVLERRGNTVVVAQSGKAHFWFFTYAIDVIVEVTEDPPDALSIRAIRGNLKELVGGYQLKKIDGKEGQYLLTWSGVIEPELPVPQALALPLMRRNIAQQFEGMVREIERREASRVQVSQR